MLRKGEQMKIFGIFKRRKKRDDTGEDTRIAAGGVIRGGCMTLLRDLLVDGHYEGSISTAGEVTVGKNGRIEGSVTSKRVVVSGVIDGEVDCDMIEVMDGGTIIGKITTVNFVIGNGGIFEGTIKKKEAV